MGHNDHLPDLDMSPPEGWLDDATWKKVQGLVPIVCIDILPVWTNENGCLHAGLIYRETPHQGRKWCMMGGRLRRNEAIHTAARRVLVETVGPQGLVGLCFDGNIQPALVTQYFTEPDRGCAFSSVDPRQHAIGLIFIVPAFIEVYVKRTLPETSEALELGWFTENWVQERKDAIGFGQGIFILNALARRG